MLSIVVITSIIYTIAIYVDKHLTNKGISRKDYFYYMCFSMVPFALIMTVIDWLREGIRFELSIIPFLLLLVAMFLRYKKQHTIVGCYKYLNPYEYITYNSLGLILAFVIDSAIGIKSFSWITAFAIILCLTGVFVLADVKLRIKALQKDLIIRMVCKVGIGYVAYYILQYWSNAVYILILNLLLTLIFSKGYNLKYHIEHKNIIKWVFIQQTFGFFTVYLGNYLATSSVVLNQAVKPLVIVMSILVAFTLKKIGRKPKIKDLLAVLLVAAGTYLLSM